MVSVGEIEQFLEAFAPASSAADWDNVGLLVGDRLRPVTRLMTCLTVTPTSAAEAIRERVDLIVSHHPLPLRPLQRLTADSTEGRLLWQVIGAGISIYSPHTAFDSAEQGINAQLAAGLGVADAEPLVVEANGSGAGRYGDLERVVPLHELVAQVKSFLKIDQLQIVGDPGRPVRRVGLACGSGGDFLTRSLEANCDCLVTGEARFHAALEAESQGIGLILAGHYATERFGVESLAQILARQFTAVEVWSSRDERDPLVWL